MWRRKAKMSTGQMPEYWRQLRAERRMKELCAVCVKPSRTGKRECHECFTIRMQKRDQRKRRAVEYLGERCADCGYQTDFMTVYAFHHREKSEKTQEISYLITANVGWEKLRKELDKCILLCANCHRIRHELESNDSP
jgi:hypothetical protein